MPNRDEYPSRPSQQQARMDEQEEFNGDSPTQPLPRIGTPTRPRPATPSPTPPMVVEPEFQRNRRRRIALPVMVALGTLAVLIVIGGLLA